jgi:hypothetical protein
MTCGSAREAILDLARGVAISEPVRAVAEEHLRECASCATDFARQRDLTAALGVLAAEAETWRPSPGIEGRLRAAFDSRLEVGPAPRRESSAFENWIGVVAVAAVIALAAWLGKRSPTLAPADGHTQPALSPPAVSSSAEQASREPVPATVEPRSASQPPVARGGPSSRRRAPSKRVRSFEFMTLPGAVGLPELESGSIVRIAVPVGALPEYGLAIETNGSKTTVEADVLVGQDGMARAIRLVGIDELSTTQDTRSRR